MSETPPYEELLHAAQADPTSADYTALRLAYARLSPYNPQENLAYMKELVEAKATIRQDMAQGRAQRALQTLADFLARDPLDADVHRLAASAYDRLRDKDKATFHRQFAQGLFDSVFCSGDGQSRETAFVVINPREEYLVLRALGTRFTVQRLDTQTGHMYDVFTLQGGAASEKKLYFHIYLPHLGMAERRAVPSQDEQEPSQRKDPNRKWWQFWK
jgi:tetratricopeptide (TPR) repeat protein